VSTRDLSPAAKHQINKRSIHRLKTRRCMRCGHPRQIGGLDAKMTFDEQRSFPSPNLRDCAIAISMKRIRGSGSFDVRGCITSSWTAVSAYGHGRIWPGHPGTSLNIGRVAGEIFLEWAVGSSDKSKTCLSPLTGDPACAPAVFINFSAESCGATFGNGVVRRGRRICREGFRL